MLIHTHRLYSICAFVFIAATAYVVETLTADFHIDLHANHRKYTATGHSSRFDLAAESDTTEINLTRLKLSRAHQARIFDAARVDERYTRLCKLML